MGCQPQICAARPFFWLEASDLLPSFELPFFSRTLHAPMQLFLFLRQFVAQNAITFPRNPRRGRSIHGLRRRGASGATTSLRIRIPPLGALRRHSLSRNEGPVKIAHAASRLLVPGGSSDVSATAAGARPRLSLKVSEVSMAVSPALARFRSPSPIGAKRVLETAFETGRLSPWRLQS